MQPTTTPALPTLRERAIQTLDYIETHYHRGAGDYTAREKSGGDAFAWGLGVLLSALVAACEIDRDRYQPRLTLLAGSLDRRYYRADGPVGGYNASPTPAPRPTDRYYDDNAWIAIAAGEVSRRVDDPLFPRMARRALAFAQSGTDKTCGGTLWQEKAKKPSFNTCSTAPTAVASLVVEPGSIAQARQQHTFLQTFLRDPADGLYWDNIQATGRGAGFAPKPGAVQKWKFSYNSALVLRLEILLAQADKSATGKAQVARLARACVKHWYNPKTAIIRDDAAFAHLLCENLFRAYDLTGDVALRDAALSSLDTLWTKVRLPNGGYPKHWQPGEAADKGGTTDLLAIASAARAYAFAVAYAPKGA